MRRHLLRLLFRVRALLLHGRAHRCPVCGVNLRRFVAHRGRPNARCPSCGALERHRLSWLYLEGRDRASFGRLLHVAPEPELASIFRRLAKEYVSFDLNHRTSVRGSITCLPFADDSFDSIYCSHVLEHVMDDRAAMRELCRVLSPSGFALLLVPITAERSFEDPTVTSPEERERLFGQHDHVRRYGEDYEDRLIEEGFQVQALAPAEVTGDPERYGVANDAAGSIFVCTKASPRV